MSFIRWPSIENSYREEFIQRAVEQFPELAVCKYAIMEKIHGTNMQFHFEPGQEMRVASRNRYLEPGSKFYDIWNILPEYQRMWDRAQRVVDRFDVSIRLFGELYGRGVQKGVDYGPKKRIGLFGVILDGQLMSPSYLKTFAALKEFLTYSFLRCI